MFLFHSRKKTSNAQRPTSNTEIQKSAFGVLCSIVGRSAYSLHPLWDLDAEKIQAALQHARCKIAQRQTRTARRFL